MPSQADQCRKKAEECRERAAQALTPEMREEFFELADLWDQDQTQAAQEKAMSVMPPR